MHVIFLTMSYMHDVNVHGIYADLMRKFRNEGHDVTIVTPRERRTGEQTGLFESEGVKILGVKTLNLQKTSIIEKGIGQILVEPLFKNAIRKYLNNNIDLVLYSTPPITLVGVVKYLKRKHPQMKTYLLLKDIFPQNAVDLGMLSKKGVKGLLYRYFRNQEKELYHISDYIGCTSPANIHYILKHNPDIVPDRVEIAPNSYEIQQSEPITDEQRNAIREKYNLPLDCPVFIYGGNLGKPQGIPFLLKCLDFNGNRSDCHFLVVGNGTEYSKIETWISRKKPKNVSLFARLPKEDYDQLVRAVDVGLIFLDYRFTIPNYPSRLLPYLIEKKPIIAATDRVCDMGYIAEENGFGYWCPSNDVEAFTVCVNKILNSDLKIMGENGYQFFLNNYTIEHTYNAIRDHFSIMR